MRRGGRGWGGGLKQCPICGYFYGETILCKCGTKENDTTDQEYANNIRELAIQIAAAINTAVAAGLTVATARGMVYTKSSNPDYSLAKPEKYNVRREY